jgi:hypothetical protein
VRRSNNTQQENDSISEACQGSLNQEDKHLFRRVIAEEPNLSQDNNCKTKSLQRSLNVKKIVSIPDVEGSSAQLYPFSIGHRTRRCGKCGKIIMG